ncbi:MULTISPECIES: putative toxin-antitoxin system toxin component, PIN family [unclassified Mesotoga]|jgi:putative PIN family toxin of toxin-antitoxin system|uniref:putative toxin-antitoxin system toxin component, PIN family n=1 Tax=unclassified Mesotoga TaxID=1184398 RepID=UPI000FF106E0|nr:MULTISPECIES: putative toxin-antitoxin system toxin component, PIN family [unclassified Mesotoga]RLL86642.1 toxin-antitoxin system toxin component, PIN family protein [Mesotoga sp. H07pep.5.4]HRX66558.1 putative toxin-antitoxin system toxin component, PIN family [Mesotoga sp.]
MKVVIDTNVVISAALGSKTCSHAVFKALEQGVIEPRIFPQELRRFIIKLKKKEKYRSRDLQGLSNFMEYFTMMVEVVEDYELVSFSSDSPDNHFISLAAARNALLITGDKLCLKSAAWQCKS